MPAPTVAELLRALDPLGQRARRGHLARLARAERGTPGLAALQAELEASGDDFQARLALALADSAGDAPGVLRALRHPNAAVAVEAAEGLGPLVPDAAALRPLLPGLPPEVRRALWRSLARAEREDVIGALLDEVLAAFGPAEAALLLPGCARADAERALPAVAHALHNWRGLARRHPELVLGWLRAELAAAPEAARLGLWTRYGDAVRLLAEKRPAALLDLGLELGPPDALPFGRLGLLLRREPARAQALLAAPDRQARLLRQGLPLDAARQLRRLPPAARLELLRPFRASEEQLARLLRQLPSPARAAIFEELFPRGERPGLRLHPALVEVLPPPLRDAEAARVGALPAVREAPTTALYYARLRDLDAARPLLEAAARGSKAEERVQALGWLIECTARNKRGLTETLAFLDRLKNEQDPVRAPALTALAAVPPGQFAEAHLEALRRQVTWAVEARDTSSSTRVAIQSLALRLLKHHAAQPTGPFVAFALSALRALARQSFPDLPRWLGQDLPRGAEGPLFEALRPALEDAATLHDYGPALDLARALGERAWDLAPLQALLARGTADDSDGPATDCAEAWLAAPATRDARVHALLDRDPSWITCWPVLEHLHGRRQEWLDPYLRGDPTPGRFLPGDTFVLLPLDTGFARWLPRQQRAFAHTLKRVARRAEAPTQERAAALWVLGRLPSSGVADLAPFVASAEVPIAEAALGALAWLGRPAEALPALLEHIGGDPTGVAVADRARVAAYALPRVARRVAPAALGAALAGLLDRPKLKVTAQKEALRLLGAFRPPGAAGLLARAWARPDLHRDARIAAGHAARRLLDVEAAWEVLAALAAGAEPDLPRSLLGQWPAALAPAHRGRYAALLLVVARHPTAAVRREAFSALVGWADIAPAELGAAAAARVLDLGALAEWAEALAALLAAAIAGAPAPLAEAVVGLARAAGAESVQPRRDRDLPARQRLARLTDALGARPASDRRRLAPALAPAADALAAEPTLWPRAAALRLAGLDWADDAASGATLLALAGQAREPALALALESALALALSRDAGPPEPLLAAADRVAGEAPGLALRLIVAAGVRSGWPDAALARLGALRARPELAVRLAALDVFVTGE